MYSRISSTVLLAAISCFLGRRIHAIKAGRNRRRTGDAHVDFLRAGAANHADNLAAGGAADDGIVDQDDALALKQAAHRIQLQLHAEIAHALAGLDKSASHIVIADQAEAEWDAALRRSSPSPRSRRNRARAPPDRHRPELRAPAAGPSSSRLSCTGRPKTRLSGREK